MGAMSISPNAISHSSIQAYLPVSCGIESHGVHSRLSDKAGIPVNSGVSKEAIVIICSTAVSQESFSDMYVMY